MVESYSSKMSILPDPYSDRAAASLEPFANKFLENRYLFPYSGIAYYIKFFIGAEARVPDWKLVKQFLIKEGKISKDHVH